MRYKNIYEYLDEKFKGRWSVGPDEIIKAKNEYWRIYNSNLKTKRRAKEREFSVRFTLEEFENIAPYVHTMPVSTFIKSAVLSFVADYPAPMIHADTSRIEQQLFLITQLIEEATIDELLPQTALTSILEGIQIIERLLKP